MFTYYYLNLIARNLFNTSSMSTLPSIYQIGLSSTKPSNNGTNVTEPDPETGYERIKFYNDGDVFTADTLEIDNDFTIANTHSVSGNGVIYATIDSNNYYLSNIIINGKTDINSDDPDNKTFTHLDNLDLIITSPSIADQTFAFDKSIKLKSFNKSADKITRLGGMYGIEYNTEEFTINGLDYKLKLVDFDSTQDSVFCRIFREYDDTYLSTKEQFIIDKDLEIKVDEVTKEMLIKITFDLLGSDTGFEGITEAEMERYITYWLYDHPIKVLYELPSSRFEEFELEDQYAYNRLALNKGENTIKLSCSSPLYPFTIEYKLLRSFAYNSQPLHFKEAIAPWENIGWYTLFDDNGILLYYGELSEVVTIPSRCILTIPEGRLKIECVNVGESLLDCYTKEEVDNKQYITEEEAKMYINEAIQATNEILDQVLRGE